MKQRLQAIFLVAPALLLGCWLLLALGPDDALDAWVAGPHSRIVTDRHGTILQILPLADGSRRIMTDLDSLPDALVEVFYRSEDERFYLHPGVDPLSIVRALIQNSSEGEVVSGGSTISMQLARIVRPHSGGLRGKISEALYALRLEAELGKRRILELWLSSIPFGFRAHGVAAASRTFFGVAPDALTTEQTLLLAVTPRRPADYNPRTNPGRAIAAAERLAARVGISVSRDQLESAVSTVVTEREVWPHLAPHFVGGLARGGPGTTLTTSLDMGVQEVLEAALQGRVSRSSEYRIGNGAGIVVDNHTGEILGYVGSVDFFDETIQGQIDGVTIRRQPGSTIKPFLYALALENGFTAATVLPDIPTEFGGEEIYVPENFNRRFNGPVRLRTALASSLNVPAVYTLYRLGVSSFVDYLIRLGFDSLRDQRHEVGTGLALGNAEVSLLELSRAFSVFVRDGVPLELRYTPVQEESTVSDRPMSAATAGLIRSILSDRVGRVTGFGTRSVLDTPFEAMFKTGTSNQFNNIWALGATAGLTVGVWMGNFSGETVIGRPGSSIPAAAVREVLAHFADHDQSLPEMQNVHSRAVCATSGGLATEYCPAVITEYFASGTDPEACDWHVGRDVPVRYPIEYQSWALQRGYTISDSVVSTGTTLTIVHPAEGAIFYIDPSIRPDDQAIRIEAVADTGQPIAVWVNESYLGEGMSPFRVLVPLRPGSIDVLVTSGTRRAERRFSVR